METIQTQNKTLKAIISLILCFVVMFYAPHVVTYMWNNTVTTFFPNLVMTYKLAWLFALLVAVLKVQWSRIKAEDKTPYDADKSLYQAQVLLAGYLLIHGMFYLVLTYL